MDNKVTKKRINEHLEYDWYIYLIILVACIVLFYFVFSQINRTRDYEDVNFFISCYDSGDNGFADRVKRDMESSRYDADKYGEAVLRDISFETQDPLGSNYGTMLQTHGMITSDVLILGESVMKTSGAGFIELTDELLTEYLLPDGVQISDFSYFTGSDLGIENDTRRFGIKVSDFSRLSGTGSVFETNWRNVSDYKEKYKDAADEEKPDDTFYLVLNRSSVSVGKFGKKAKDKNAQALYLVRRFIEFYK